MKRSISIFAVMLLTLIPGFVQAQSSEADEVQAVIEQLFEGMLQSDSAMVADTFKKDAIMQTIMKTQNGEVRVGSSELHNFLNSIHKAEAGLLIEKIGSYQIKVDGELASAWTPYEFFVGDQFSHCGVNSFQLVNEGSGWKIFHIVDTRRKENCVEN